MFIKCELVPKSRLISEILADLGSTMEEHEAAQDEAMDLYEVFTYVADHHHTEAPSSHEISEKTYT